MEEFHTSPERETLDELEASLALDGLATVTQPEAVLEIPESEIYLADTEERLKVIGFKIETEMPETELTAPTPQSRPQQEKTIEHEEGCNTYTCYFS